MRRFGPGGVAALWLGLAVAPALAGPPEARGEEKEQTSWWSGLFGGKKAEPKPAADPAKTVADKAAEQDRLMRAFLRRSAVCDRLRDIARDPDRPNPALEEQADRLEQLAWKLYTERSGKVLGVAAVGKTAADLEATDATVDTAEALRGAAPGGPAPRARATPGRATREDER